MRMNALVKQIKNNAKLILILSLVPFIIEVALIYLFTMFFTELKGGFALALGFIIASSGPELIEPKLIALQYDGFDISDKISRAIFQTSTLQMAVSFISVNLIIPIICTHEIESLDFSLGIDFLIGLITGIISGVIIGYITKECPDFMKMTLIYLTILIAVIIFEYQLETEFAQIIFGITLLYVFSLFTAKDLPTSMLLDLWDAQKSMLYFILGSSILLKDLSGSLIVWGIIIIFISTALKAQITQILIGCIATVKSRKINMKTILKQYTRQDAKEINQIIETERGNQQDEKTPEPDQVVEEDDDSEIVLNKFEKELYINCMIPKGMLQALMGVQLYEMSFNYEESNHDEPDHNGHEQLLELREQGGIILIISAISILISATYGVILVKKEILLERIRAKVRKKKLRKLAKVVPAMIRSKMNNSKSIAGKLKQFSNEKRINEMKFDWEYETPKEKQIQIDQQDLSLQKDNKNQKTKKKNKEQKE